jgi:hypothetical protein
VEAVKNVPAMAVQAAPGREGGPAVAALKVLLLVDLVEELVAGLAEVVRIALVGFSAVSADRHVLETTL